MKAAPTGSSALGLQGCRLCPLSPICKPTPRTRGLRKVSKHSPAVPCVAHRALQGPWPSQYTRQEPILQGLCRGNAMASCTCPRAPHLHLCPLSQRGRPCLKSTQGSLTCPNWPWLPPPGAGLFPAGHPADQPFRGPKIAPQSHVCPSTDRKLVLYIATITICMYHMCACVTGQLTTWGGYALSSRPACFRDPDALKAMHY